MKGMQPVLTAQAQREADRLTVAEFGLPGLTLMETAGRAAAANIGEAMHPIAGKHVGIVAGKGNNGGDGLVIARVLHAKGAKVRVWMAGGIEEMPPDAAHNRKLLEAIASQAPEESIAIGPLEGVLESQADVFVDALLGTGLKRTLRPRLQHVVKHLNTQPAPVVAVDIPTGLDADTGKVLGQAIQADFTVTMGTLKPGHLFDAGPVCTGRVIPVDIGIPPHILLHTQRSYGCTWYSMDAGVRHLLPARAPDAHKYSAGMVLAIGGSSGLTGAAVMASQAAARAGAGYVTCATHASVAPVLAANLTAVATVSLPETTPGDLDPGAALTALAGPLRKAKALLVGPGLGRGSGTQDFVCTLLRTSTLPAVVDADGLNSWIGRTHDLARSPQGRWIMTPHAGELARLTGDASISDRLHTARTWARRWNAVLIVKGMPSVVGTPDGEVFVCGAGNSALATAGTGDVLSGICAGLLAQGLSPKEAAVAALHLGGRCADHYCRDRAAESMTATDMLTVLPRVLKLLRPEPQQHASVW